jgi:hypothetical protein
MAAWNDCRPSADGALKVPQPEPVLVRPELGRQE